MKKLTFLIIAGDPSGDLAAADLVKSLQRHCKPHGVNFIGAGGPAMKLAGVDLIGDLTQYSVIGIDILRKLRELHSAYDKLLQLALRETPDFIVGVDYAGFNLRFAKAIRQLTFRNSGPFHNWRPRIVQYISPQVWASRPGRSKQMESTHDLLLSILPFEVAWYNSHAPRLNVQFVGHPLVDRQFQSRDYRDDQPTNSVSKPLLLLLPGSRSSELKRHLPVMIPAARQIRDRSGAQILMVLPRQDLLVMATPHLNDFPEIQVQIGGLCEALTRATVAMASTGTVTLECAWFGVPTVTLYKTSSLTYQIARRIITVSHLAMPNLLAGKTLMPELIQDYATPESLCAATLELLEKPTLRDQIRQELRNIASSLGKPGTSDRAAAAILKTL